jgi:MHS family proline/betaine transporter-like MFS transporter
LPKEDVEAWGWRIPFWVSLLLAPLLYNIVSHTEESKFWAERAEQKETEQFIRESEHADRPAVVDLFGSPFRRRQLAGMIGVLSAVASSFYTLFLWTPVYLSELRGVMHENEADLLNFFVVGCYIFLLLIAGKLSDMFPHRMDLVRIGLPGVIIGCPVMFGMFESESYWGYLFGQLQFAICLSFVQGCMAAWEVELWMADPTLSFTGVAIGHNIAATVFGGTMPLVATFLFYRSDALAENSGDDSLYPRLIPGLYISLLGSISLYCISYVIRHPHDVRTGSHKLREAIRKENQKFKAAQKAKMKSGNSSSNS